MNDDVRDEPDGPASWADRLVDGKTWLSEGPETIEAVWGDDTHVLAARLQPTMIAAAGGAGKTTLVQRLALGALGIDGFTTLLGLPVTPTTGKVLYLAADRPEQARLSMRRMVTTVDAWDIVAKRLVVWPGPPPADVGRQPAMLRDLARLADATLTIPDSLKDMAMRLSTDEVGAIVNNAFQLVVADDRDLVVPHHVRKMRSDDPDRAVTIDDLFGSAWLFNGCGSVLYLEQSAIDTALRQLKSPNGTSIEMRFTLNRHSGALDVGADDPLLAIVVAAGPDGISTTHVARVVFVKAKPTEAELERCRRRLKTLEQAGVITLEGSGRKSRWIAEA